MASAQGCRGVAVRRGTAAVVLAVAAGVAACGRPSAGTTPGTSASTTVVVEAARATGGAERPEPLATVTTTTERRSVRVVVGGDVHGEGRVATLLASGATPLAALAAFLGAADVVVVNLETPVATAPTKDAGNGGPNATKEYVFLADPALVRALASDGVHVVTLANNHALDHGTDALLETIAHARAAGLTVVGAGATAADAFRPGVVETRGGPVAVVGLSRVVPLGWAATGTRPGVASAYDERSALQAVRDAATLSPHVVVVVHWGVERAVCADAHQVRLARLLIDAGADVVAGHHPHVLQGAGTVGSAVVAYSLGNLVWYHSNPPADVTGVLDVELAGGGVREWTVHPASIDTRGRPVPLDPERGQAVASTISARMPGHSACPD